MWLSQNSGKITAGVLVLLLCAYGVWIFGYGELADEPTYAALQGVEVQNRSPALTRLTALTINDLGLIIGVPTDDPMFPNAWVATSKTKLHGVLYIVGASTAHLQFTCDDARTFFSDPKTASVSQLIRGKLERFCMTSASAKGPTLSQVGTDNN